ncbi:hypothetical protein [Chryseobacterium bernardetii]|uniref:hypothetical protein n=1 Tax=Chryseobacterium bernardetii TaxID=1241978 RepID=UPI003AF44426
MKRILKAFIIFATIIGMLFLWYDQSRSFFKATNGESITMWKRYGGTCYLISGKYYGVTKPKDGYIETSNRSYLTLYYSNKLPNFILLRKESNYDYKAYNSIDKKYFFEDYTSNKERYKPIIYKENAEKFSDVNKDASFLSINILEGYATDGTGKTQR